MSKVICDICGTQYPDTADACPICGYPRQDSEKRVSSQNNQNIKSSRTGEDTPKGGKFSAKNVKKRQGAEKISDNSSRHNHNAQPRRAASKELNLDDIDSILNLDSEYTDKPKEHTQKEPDSDAQVEPAANPAEKITPQKPEHHSEDETSEPEEDEFDAAFYASAASDEKNQEDEIFLTEEEIKPTAPVSRRTPETSKQSRKDSGKKSVRKKEKKSRGGVIVWILLAAVIVVGAYIGWRFYQGADAYNQEFVPVTTEAAEEILQPTQTETASEELTVPVETGVPCVGLSVSDEHITFDEMGHAWLLSVVALPEGTTDTVIFTSSDETVATVNDQGRITSVGSGEATITISCGDIVRYCYVECAFEGMETQPEETAAAPETEPENQDQTQETQATEPAFNNTNVNYKDQNWTMSDSDGDATLIIGEAFTLELTNDAGETAKVEWKSDNEGVVRIEGNIITGQYVGITDLTATIGGKTFTCIVRVIANR